MSRNQLLEDTRNLLKNRKPIEKVVNDKVLLDIRVPILNIENSVFE